MCFLESRQNVGAAGNGVRYLGYIEEEGLNVTEGDLAPEDEESALDGDQDVADLIDEIDQGHDELAHKARLPLAGEEAGIEVAEVIRRDFFKAEGLDDLLARNQLFDAAVNGA